jgi:hypothetical protein
MPCSLLYSDNLDTLRFPLAFSCSCFLTSYNLAHNLCRYCQVRHERGADPGSECDLGLKGVGGDAVLKVVDLEAANQECTLSVNRRCYIKTVSKGLRQCGEKLPGADRKSKAILERRGRVVQACSQY